MKEIIENDYDIRIDSSGEQFIENRELCKISNLCTCAALNILRFFCLSLYSASDKSIFSKHFS